jgi:glyoxylase-like metal-dependent hydrolase (beta-lactamase superfamily II)
MTMDHAPVLACFDPEAAAFAAGVPGACVVTGGQNERAASRAILSAAAEQDENRLYVVALGGGVSAACRFAAPRGNAVAALLLGDGPADLPAAESLKDTPIRLLRGPKKTPCGLAAALRNAGSRTLAEMDCPSEAARREASADSAAWLTAQNLADRLCARQLQPGLWNIESEKIDSFYLIAGEEKGLVIDTGMGRKPVLPLLRELTALPLEAAFTHVHGDHCYHADEFDRRYLCPREAPLLPVFVQKMMPEKPFRMADFLPLDEGDVLSLGGNDIEVLRLAGHTPGSLVFVDHAHRCLFTGDAIGSGIGVLMSIFGALPLWQYQKELTAFRRKIVPYEGYAMYGGHRAQETEEVDGAFRYHPLCADTVDEMIELCEKLLRGDALPFEARRSPWVNEPVRYYRYGSAGMWITESQISAR